MEKAGAYFIDEREFKDEKPPTKSQNDDSPGTYNLPRPDYLHGNRFDPESPEQRRPTRPFGLASEFPRTSTPYRPQYSLVSSTSSRKPPKYDGSTSVKDYLVQFDMLMALNNWAKSRAALELATSLVGPAREVLSDMASYERTDFNMLTTALKNRFEPENQQQIYRVQLKQRLRKSNESLPELAHDIKKLVRKANPDASAIMREKLAQDAFIDALNERDLQWAVLQSDPDSVDEAVSTALQYEAIHKKVDAFQTQHQDRNMLRSTQPSEMDKFTEKFASMMERFEQHMKQLNALAGGLIKLKKGKKKLSFLDLNTHFILILRK